MTDCNNQMNFSPLKKGKKVSASFEAEPITSDAGIILLSEIDRKIGLLSEAAEAFEDPRQQTKVKHSIKTMLEQRVYAIALGYEDLNDHNQLKLDPCFQTAVGTTNTLASSPTLSRFENRADRRIAVKLHDVLFNNFIKSFNKAPKELVLDFDATDDLVHGKQAGSFFNGYYGHYCFLPLYVFCGDHLLTAYLRQSNRDPALHSWAILKLLVENIRKKWPKVKIIFRGDCGFMRHKIFNWCEKNNVHYITGLGKNNVLMKAVKHWTQKAENLFEVEQTKQRHFAELTYQAGSWKRERRVIVKAEYNHRGPNTRFIVTNLEGDPQELYDRIYCQRGKMEQSIDEQISFFSDRTSCSDWWANQLRLLLSSLAYVLVDTLRRTCLKNTELEKARCKTIRLKLFKVGAIVIRNTRRIRIKMSKSYPFRDLFYLVYQRLNPG